MTAMLTPPATRRPAYEFSAEQCDRLRAAGLLPAGGEWTGGGPLPFRFTVAEYRRMIELGILQDGDPAELIDGEVVQKMSKGDPHALAVEALNRLLARALPDDLSLRCQAPITLADGEPEPDFTVCLPPAARGNRHPRPEHVFVVIEVADTSLAEDRGPTLSRYAGVGIPVYWIVNVADGELEVHSDPITPARGRPVYRRVAVYPHGESVPLEVRGQMVMSVPVSDILR